MTVCSLQTTKTPEQEKQNTSLDYGLSSFLADNTRCETGAWWIAHIRHMKRQQYAQEHFITYIHSKVLFESFWIFCFWFLFVASLTSIKMGWYQIWSYKMTIRMYLYPWIFSGSLPAKQHQAIFMIIVRQSECDQVIWPQLVTHF